RLAGTRARAVQPASAIVANMCVAVSQSTRLCSMSTVSQEKPARARNRAAVMLPNDSQVPAGGSPFGRARLRGLARMTSAGGQRSEVRGKRSEIRGQRSEVRNEHYSVKCGESPLMDARLANGTPSPQPLSPYRMGRGSSINEPREVSA